MSSQVVGRGGTFPHGQINRSTWRTVGSRKLSFDGVPLIEDLPAIKTRNENYPPQLYNKGEDKFDGKTQPSNVDPNSVDGTEGHTRSSGFGLRLPLQGVKGASEDGGRKHTWASARKRNGVQPVDGTGSKQDVTEPGATALEVNTIYRAKLIAYRVRRFCANAQVQRTWNVVFAILVAWFVGRMAMSLIPGLRNEVGEFLRAVDLEQYTEQLADKGYVSLQDMLLVTEEDLKEYAGIRIVPHRRRILHHAQALKQKKPLLPTLCWLTIIIAALAVVLFGIAVLISSRVRDRVVCVSMFFAFMSWHRVRMWHRLWNTLDVVSSPRVVPKVCEPPTVAEPQRTFSSTSILTSPTEKGPRVADARTSVPPSLTPRNGDNHLLNRLRKRRNRP